MSVEFVLPISYTPEYNRECVRKWRERHPEEYKERERKYRSSEKAKERRRALRKLDYEANKEQIKQANLRAYYLRTYGPDYEAIVLLKNISDDIFQRERFARRARATQRAC